MSKRRSAARIDKWRARRSPAALAMRKQGRTYQTIGEAFGVTVWQAMQLVRKGEELERAVKV
jgi:hypothetical protein